MMCPNQMRLDFSYEIEIVIRNSKMINEHLNLKMK